MQFFNPMFIEAKETCLALILAATRHAPGHAAEAATKLARPLIDDAVEFTVCRAVAAAAGGHESIVAAILSTGTTAIEEPESFAEGLTAMLTGRPDWHLPLNAVMAVSTDENTRSLAGSLLAMSSLRS